MSGAPERCRKCGGPLVPSPFFASGVDDRKCVCCGWYWTANHAERRQAEKSRGYRHYGTCRAKGCGKKVDAARNSSGLCRDCGYKQRSWEISAKTLPPPFVEVGGELVVNQARIEAVKEMARCRK